MSPHYTSILIVQPHNTNKRIIYFCFWVKWQNGKWSWQHRTIMNHRMVRELQSWGYCEKNMWSNGLDRQRLLKYMVRLLRESNINVELHVISQKDIQGYSDKLRSSGTIPNLPERFVNFLKYKHNVSMLPASFPILFCTIVSCLCNKEIWKCFGLKEMTYMIFFYVKLQLKAR